MKGLGVFFTEKYLSWKVYSANCQIINFHALCSDHWCQLFDCAGSLLDRLLPVSAPTRRQSGAAASGDGTRAGWRPGRSGCRRPAARPPRPQTPPLPPAAMSCPPGASGGRCHSGSGCSEQLWGQEGKQTCRWAKDKGRKVFFFIWKYELMSSCTYSFHIPRNIILN